LQVNIANSMVRVLLRKRELRGLLAEFEKMSSQQLIPADLVTRARRFTSIADGPSTQVALDDDESRVEARRTAASWPFHDFAHIGSRRECEPLCAGIARSEGEAVYFRRSGSAFQLILPM
jgi:hypothetical protein